LSQACPDWNSDDPRDNPRIIANARTLRAQVERDALTRPAPSLDLALDWHRKLHEGVRVVEPDYVGNIRDSDPGHPCLVGYEVVVGSFFGVRATDVPGALATFIGAVGSVIATLDRAITPGSIPSDPRLVQAVVRLCAYTHGEWIRIHPFANGNGRTARVWANWIAIRYGLPPFVAIKPRPGHALFAGAAARSMSGDHHVTEALFLELLNDTLAAIQTP
jgi:fido (protein-threonine AMPylation protein)